MPIVINPQTAGGYLPSQTAGTYFVVPQRAPRYTFAWPYLGAAVSGWQFNNQISRGLLGGYFNYAIPEIAGKPEQLVLAAGVYNWGPLDQFVSLAQSLGLPMRYHCLAWPAMPEFVKALTYAQMLTFFDDMCLAVANRYGASAWQAVEVCNEFCKRDLNLAAPLKDGSNPLDPLTYNLWFTKALAATGDGKNCVKDLFTRARARFAGTAKFGWNEGNLNWSFDATSNFDAAVAAQQGTGVVVDWMGSQHHEASWQDATNLVAKTQYFLQRCVARGCKARITEYDESIYPDFSSFSYGANPPASLMNQQALKMGAMFAACKAQQIITPGLIEEVTMWGTDDGYTYLSSDFGPRVDRPLLFDQFGNPKGCYLAIAP